jgi:hypothetical protein
MCNTDMKSVHYLIIEFFLQMGKIELYKIIVHVYDFLCSKDFRM